MLTICNAFSLSMLDHASAERPVFTALTEAEAQQTVVDEIDDGGDIESAIGHADTAALYSALLRVDLAASRRSVTLAADGPFLVGQCVGPRLPEGATTLPEGARILWWLVSVEG